MFHFPLSPSLAFSILFQDCYVRFSPPVPHFLNCLLPHLSTRLQTSIAFPYLKPFPILFPLLSTFPIPSPFLQFLNDSPFSITPSSFPRTSNLSPYLPPSSTAHKHPISITRKKNKRYIFVLLFSLWSPSSPEKSRRDTPFAKKKGKKMSSSKTPDFGGGCTSPSPGCSTRIIQRYKCCIVYWFPL